MKSQYSFPKPLLQTKIYLAKILEILLITLFFATLPVTILPIILIMWWIKEDVRERIVKKLAFLDWITRHREPILIKVIEAQNIEDLTDSVMTRIQYNTTRNMDTETEKLYMKVYIKKIIGSWKDASVKDHNPGDLI